MTRIILSAVIAIGFHISLMVLNPSIIKKNTEILPPPIKSIMVKSVMVTLSYRQPAIKKETHSPKPIEIIKTKPKPMPKPKQALSFTPKKKTSPVLKKKSLPAPKKKVTQKEVIKRPLIPVKVAPVKTTLTKTTPVKTEVAQTIPAKTIIKSNFKVQPAPLKETSPQKKENIKQAHIEFAQPLYKKNSLPAYPVIARKRGYQGIVELMVLVSEKGKISSLKIFKSSGYKSLDRQALKTVKNWLFEPGKKNGTPQEMWVRIPVKFEIK